MKIKKELKYRMGNNTMENAVELNQEAKIGNAAEIVPNFAAGLSKHNLFYSNFKFS